MTVERKTETVEVRLLNGESKQVQIYKYITPKEKFDLLRSCNLKFRQVKNEFELDLADLDLMAVLEKLGETIWDPENKCGLGDVDGNSYMSVVSERVSCFLGDFGLGTEVANSASSSS